MIDNGEYFFPDPNKPRVKHEESSGFVYYVVPLMIYAAFFYIAMVVLSTI